MPLPFPTSMLLTATALCTLGALTTLTGCATTADTSSAGTAPPSAAQRQQQLNLLNRVSWGVNDSADRVIIAQGTERYLQQQLHPHDAPLPAALQAQIDAMTIVQTPMDQLNLKLEQQRKDADAVVDIEQKKTAQQAYQQELNRVAKEAATRSLLRDLYSTNQLQEQMTWFWLNHFNVHLYKSNLRVLVGDYEDQAIRPHALGKFRDLLSATVHHPAMLRYLDNEQNAAGHINENYARELMELHTLGVNGGYTQHDVIEVARCFTGWTIEDPRKGGGFLYNDKTHDKGEKVVLGHVIPAGGGMEDGEKVLDILAHHPSTAKFI